MSSSELNELSKKSKTASQELWRWRMRQLDIPTQLLRLTVLVAGFLIWQYELIFKGYFLIDKKNKFFAIFRLLISLQNSPYEISKSYV